MKKLNVKLLTALIIIIITAIISADLLARAGGAGGSSYDGGGSGSDAEGLINLVIWIIMSLPFRANIIVAAIIIGGFIIFSYLTKKKIQQKSILNQLPSGEGIKKAPGYDKFIRNNPEYNESEFIDKVRKAFIDIQDAWQKKDISGVRKFISDGVYQRFNTQFRMMDLLGQTNTIDDLEVKNIYIDRVDTDGLYDIIHVAIHASITDRFISTLEPSLNSGGTEDFVEYWSFLKKRGKPGKDIYYTDNCPNCGSPLPGDMGEVSRCASCGTLTNSGEYDWVLSEITQADDYISVNKKLHKSADLTEKIRDLIHENDDFSVQLIEDKASNGYLQIITSLALNDPAIMRRFVNDSTFEKITSQMTGDQIAYNRIYLNDVTLIGVSEDRTLNILAVSVKSSFQRVSLKNGAVSVIDPAVISKNEVLLMSRDKNAARSRGSLYSHCCPGCGAPVENSLDIKCGYCGITMNSTGNEWIITDIMSVPEYREYHKANISDFSYSVKHELVDKLYDVRDFAFNNIMVVIAVDGSFTEQEKQFARELAVKWKYDPGKIEPFFRMAMNGQLVIRMPEDPDKQKKIYSMMENAAAADENISPVEQQLLDVIRQQYDIR